MEVEDFPDRLAAYGRIKVPSLMIGFGGDLMIPSYLARELAEAIPGARYEEILVELVYARICAAPYPPTVGARVDRVGVAGQLESSDACWADHIPQPRGLVAAAGA